jgi:L-threonylcarbamoyladenylate synthase
VHTPALISAASAIRAGQLVVFPTETVYGLGANALDAKACAAIFEAKGRPAFNPLIVHVSNWTMLEQLVRDVPAWARQLANRFWPGPLSLILPKHDRVPDIVTAGLSTVAIRIPKHPLALELINAAGLPIAAPSANLFTQLSPTRVDDARAQLGNKVSCYLDGGPCAVGLESTIVGELDGKLTLLRPGGTPIEAIEAEVGPLQRVEKASAVVAPGMLTKHYAPSIPVVIDRGHVPFTPPRNAGLLTLTATEADRRQFAHIEELSPSGDLREAAANLFQALRRLSSKPISTIVARPVPEQGLGLAINDRLKRAAG